MNSNRKRKPQTPAELYNLVCPGQSDNPPGVTVKNSNLGDSIVVDHIRRETFTSREDMDEIRAKEVQMARAMARRASEVDSFPVRRVSWPPSVVAPNPPLPSRPQCSKTTTKSSTAHVVTVTSPKKTQHPLQVPVGAEMLNDAQQPTAEDFEEIIDAVALPSHEVEA